MTEAKRQQPVIQDGETMVGICLWSAHPWAQNNDGYTMAQASMGSYVRWQGPHMHFVDDCHN